MNKKLTPYQKIMRAAKCGTGCRLTPEECFEMSLDAAIAEVALNDEILAMEAKTDE